MTKPTAFNALSALRDADADMENRITTNMGAVDLVIEPIDRADPGYRNDEFWASVEWAGDRPVDPESQYSGLFRVTEAQALDLIGMAKGSVFGTRKEAYLWLNRAYSAMSHYRPRHKLAA